MEGVGGEDAIDRQGLVLVDQPHVGEVLHPAVGGHFPVESRLAEVVLVPEHLEDHQQTQRDSLERREIGSQKHGLVHEKGWKVDLPMMQLATHREIHQSQ